jgi:hypothetical protein
VLTLSRSECNVRQRVFWLCALEGKMAHAPCAACVRRASEGPECLTCLWLYGWLWRYPPAFSVVSSSVQRRFCFSPATRDCAGQRIADDRLTMN